MLISYQEGSIWRASRITEVGDAPRMGGRKASLRGSKIGSPRMEVESCLGRSREKDRRKGQILGMPAEEEHAGSPQARWDSF